MTKMVFPIMSGGNGAIVAVHTYDADSAGKVASSVNRFAGNATLVHVGEPFVPSDWDGKGVLTVDGVAVPVNPTYARVKDPQGWALAGMVAVATAPKVRKRAAAKPAAKPATTGKARATRVHTPKPTTTAAKATTAAKRTTAAKSTAAKVKAGTSA